MELRLICPDAPSQASDASLARCPESLAVEAENASTHNGA